MIALIYFVTTVHAQSAFEQALGQDNGVTSVESWVEIKNQKYRKYEFNGGSYYVMFRKNDKKTADVFCAPPDGFQKESLIVEQPKAVKRPPAFAKAFHDSCSQVRDNRKTPLHLDPDAGLENPTK